jgi:hypothetical protein
MTGPQGHPASQHGRGGGDADALRRVRDELDALPGGAAAVHAQLLRGGEEGLTDMQLHR